MGESNKVDIDGYTQLILNHAILLIHFSKPYFQKYAKLGYDVKVRLVWF